MQFKPLPNYIQASRRGNRIRHLLLHLMGRERWDEAARRALWQRLEWLIWLK